jgi:hypothetical protein
VRYRIWRSLVWSYPTYRGTLRVRVYGQSTFVCMSGGIWHVQMDKWCFKRSLKMKDGRQGNPVIILGKLTGMSPEKHTGSYRCW